MIAFVYLFLFALGIVLVLILDSNMASADKPLKIAEESPTNYTTPSQVANTINITTYSTSMILCELFMSKTPDTLLSFVLVK